MTASQLGRLLRGNYQGVNAGINRLINAGVCHRVNSGALCFPTLEARQGIDRTNAARQAKFRARRNAKVTALQPLPVTGPVTPYARSRESRESESESEEFFLEGQSENPKGGRPNSNGQPPPENPDHQNQENQNPETDNPYGATGLAVHPDDFNPPDPATAFTPTWPHLSSIDGELGDAIDHLLGMCHDKDAGTPNVIDRLAAPLNPAEIRDAIQAIKATSPNSPTRYAVRILQTHKAGT